MKIVPSTALSSTATLFFHAVPTTAWGSGGDRYSGSGMYSQSGAANWLHGIDGYPAKSLNFEYLGCAWANADEDGQDLGCLEDSSEDGTTYWYQMANCRRAQPVYNVYGSTSSSRSSCSTNTFLESFSSRTSLAGFVSTLQTYNGYGGGLENYVYDLPMCDQQDDDGYYLMLGCSEYGTFTIDKFSDAYCNNPIGTSDTLSTVNKYLSKLSSCTSCYDSSNGDPSDSACAYLIADSESCSTLDHAICSDADGSKSSSYKTSQNSGSHSSTATFVSDGLGNKIKYILGSAFLCASFIMFLGILMMNRRKRRANLNRKFRQAASRSGKSRSKSRSSKTSTRSERSRKSRSRSSSRPRREGNSSNVPAGDTGVYA
mmetsp:Transcript_49147/g.73034  ORF Transcript_49147/g.73034 Transcript_49147/m.73034 type:complete len:372 (-) Transcript_49147:124-1239(-)|eukprot:CAMPEP_0195520638 /NCGR_PEP_ID=MMETSP0794_2-20130614/17335_1 /TAXON_ID=515487 /ORGANISM="Stephanopyxis turris, Strain CCMP 815" /LENGTH=371 /DNA_ID=CAMNT_0040650041 /DNA_START=140 /DNA_END=1255 /DNA_ORIENTATION=+